MIARPAGYDNVCSQTEGGNEHRRAASVNGEGGLPARECAWLRRLVEPDQPTTRSLLVVFNAPATIDVNMSRINPMHKPGFTHAKLAFSDAGRDCRFTDVARPDKGDSRVVSYAIHAV
jgi:hypothetical protein